MSSSEERLVPAKDLLTLPHYYDKASLSYLKKKKNIEIWSLNTFFPPKKEKIKTETNQCCGDRFKFLEHKHVL